MCSHSRNTVIYACRNLDPNLGTKKLATPPSKKNNNNETPLGERKLYNEKLCQLAAALAVQVMQFQGSLITQVLVSNKVCTLLC